MKTTIFPPFYGEFGWLIMTHIRYVHAHPAQYKIVCCEKGTEVLFPSASVVETFEHPTKTDVRWCKTVWGDSSALEEHRRQMIATLLTKYPDAEIDKLEYDCHWHTSDGIKFKPIAKSVLPPVDIVLGVRKRAFVKEGNFQHWQPMAKSLTALGYTVGLAGAASSSFDFDADAKSWEHPNGATEGVVDLLNKCRLFVGTDSGVSHLAAMMDVPMIVWWMPNNGSPDETGTMERANKSIFRKLVSDVKDQPDRIVSCIKTVLESEAVSRVKMVDNHSNKIQFNKFLLRHQSRLLHRFDSFRTLFDECSKRDAKVIVETGTSRTHDNWEGDGLSTYLFGQYCEIFGAYLWTVDVDVQCINTSRKITKDFEKYIKYEAEDSVKFLSDFHQKIDVLYIDSLDYLPGQESLSQRHALNEFLSAESKLHSHSLVLIDDCGVFGGGKGGELIPYMVSRNWVVKYFGYQVLLEYRNAISDAKTEDIFRPFNRSHLLCNINPKDKICVEVGVWKGDFAAEILRWNPMKLHLIDPWSHQNHLINPDALTNVSDDEFSKIYHEIKQRFRNDSRVFLHRDYSVESAKLFENNSIDFIYIDGNHSYLACLADIQAWYPKVKPGGWLCGHDYTGSFPGVQKAVIEFTKNAGLDLLTIEQEWASWGIIKKIDINCANSHRKLLFVVAVQNYRTKYLEFTAPRMREYAHHHGLELIEIADYICERPPAWIKVLAVLDKLDELNDGDEISWIDADVCIVDNRYRLRTNKSLGIAIDSSGNINSGVIAFKINSWTRDFLKTVWSCEYAINHPWWENLAIIDILKNMEPAEFSLHVELLPSSFNVTQDSGVVWFRHFAGGQKWDPKWFSLKSICEI